MKNGLILEDLADAQQWLLSVLESSFPGMVIEVVSSVSEATEKLQSYKPDIALVDLNLPDGSGVSVLQNLNKNHADCVAVVTTTYDDDESLFSALCAGAQGYLLKEQKKEILIDALKGISEGRPALSPQISMRILDFFASGSASKPAQTEPTEPTEPMNPAEQDSYQLVDKLTRRETDVLKEIARGSSTKKTAEVLNVSFNTVASHIKSIYAKLNISSRAEVVHEAIRLGINNH
ncbi:MAG: response regulator transcription factor [Gammaproteobacteria bacterium]|nr:response regulator transcription factor [Gammaproteobacteria bacterium]